MEMLSFHVVLLASLSSLAADAASIWQHRSLGSKPSSPPRTLRTLYEAASMSLSTHSSEPVAGTHRAMVRALSDSLLPAAFMLLCSWKRSIRSVFFFVHPYGRGSISIVVLRKVQAGELLPGRPSVQFLFFSNVSWSASGFMVQLLNT